MQTSEELVVGKNALKAVFSFIVYLINLNKYGLLTKVFNATS